MTKDVFDDIRRRLDSGDWLYDADLEAWIDRRDNQAYTLYLQLQANKGRIKRAEDAIWADEIEPLIEQAAALEGVSPAWVLERLTQRRSAMKQATAEFDERVAAARAARKETKDAPYVWELKAAGQVGTLKGLLASYNNLDSAGDIIRPGAFAKTLQEHKARPYSAQGILPLLYQHDHKRPIGVFTSLEDTPKGLAFEAKLNRQTRDGAEAWSNIQMGALSGMSIGFFTVKAGYDAGGNRLLLEVKLNEGSLVTLPANDEARIQSAS